MIKYYYFIFLLPVFIAAIINDQIIVISNKTEITVVDFRQILIVECHEILPGCMTIFYRLNRFVFFSLLS